MNNTQLLRANRLIPVNTTALVSVELLMNISSSLETIPVRNFGEGITCVLKFTSFLDSCSNSHNCYNVIYFKNLQLCRVQIKKTIKTGTRNTNSSMSVPQVQNKLFTKFSVSNMT